MKNRIGLTLIGMMAVSSFGSVFAQGPGADTYKAKCQMCHGASGLGDTPAGKAMGARAFNSAAVVGESDADLMGIITSGKGKMPAYSGKLTTAQIKDLVATIRMLQK